MTYWERRQRELNQALEKDEAKLKKRLSSFYDAEYRKLEKEIAAYYSQYGENNVIAYRRLMESLPEEDKRLLLERMDNFAEKYPEYAHLLPVRESIYKLNRLEGLQQSILLQQLEIGAVNEAEIRKHLEKQAARNASAAAETMGFGKNFYAENSQLVRQIVNTAWCNGKNFSQRIWDNVEKLAGYLGTDLAQGFARGDSYERLVKQLRQRFGKVSRNDAYRLIYTEGTFVMNEARAASFEQDTEEYIFRVQYDAIRRNGWRDICDDLDGQTFLWSERRPGINFPPMHAWCHCTATPYVSDWNAWMDRYVQRHGSGQAETIEGRLEDMQDYRPFSLDENDRDIHTRGSVKIVAKRVLGIENDIYVSDSIKLKRRELHFANTNVTEALKKIGGGLEDKRPRVIIISDEEMQTGAVASYNYEINVLYLRKQATDRKILLSLQKGLAVSGDPQSTYVHEFIHWKDRMEYEKKHSRSSDYLKWLRNRCQKQLDTIGISEYNVGEISNYAEMSYRKGHYDEVFTEYRTRQLLER